MYRFYVGVLQVFIRIYSFLEKPPKVVNFAVVLPNESRALPQNRLFRNSHNGDSCKGNLVHACWLGPLLYRQNPVKRTRPRGQRLFPGGKSTITVEDITAGAQEYPQFREHKSTLPAKWRTSHWVSTVECTGKPKRVAAKKSRRVFG